MVLEVLKRHLDLPSIHLLETRLEKNPRLTYTDFWSEFRGKHLRDCQAVNKRNWELCTLKKGKGGQVDIQDWAEFRAQFERAQAYIVNTDPYQARKLVFRNLTAELQEECRREVKERRAGRELLQIDHDPAMDSIALVREIALQRGVSVTIINRKPGVVEVDCGSTQVKNVLLGADRTTVWGSMVRI